MSNLLASLDHTGRRRVVLGHTLNTLWHVIQKKSHVLSNFTVLCWAVFTAILGCTWPVGHRLDTPASVHLKYLWLLLVSHTSIKLGENYLSYIVEPVILQVAPNYCACLSNCLVFVSLLLSLPVNRLTSSLHSLEGKHSTWPTMGAYGRRNSSKWWPHPNSWNLHSKMGFADVIKLRTLR